MGKLFDRIQVKKPPMNKFDLSHERKLSMHMGDLVPVFVQPIMPGDKFRVRQEVMMRMLPMLAPIMHRVNVTTHYYFVPNRLVWDEWEQFISPQDPVGGVFPTPPVPPSFSFQEAVTAGMIQNGSLADHMGLPTDPAGSLDHDISISALPFRAYQLIWNEFYRDQHLQQPINVSKASGTVTGGDLQDILTLNIRCWEKDYFTSARPWAQAGEPVGLPVDVEGFAPLIANTVTPGADPVRIKGDENSGTAVEYGILGGEPPAVPVGPPNLWAKISGLTSMTTINEFRRALKLQEWLERSARAGSRYIEQILVQFGVRVPDFRLQRPEFLGGSRNPMQISEVLSTLQQVDPSSGDPVGTPQGDMSGHGLSFGNNNGFSQRFQEHGYVIGIMSVLPRTAYQQGVPRHLTLFDKFDYPWPLFGNLGEQEVKYKELFYNGKTAQEPNLPDDTFGYQSRYAEYKYGCSTVHGEMKGSLNYWHMGRIFTSQPALDASFVSADPTRRIFAVDDSSDKLIVHIYNKVDAIRPLPYFGTPSI